MTEQYTGPEVSKLLRESGLDFRDPIAVFTIRNVNEQPYNACTYQTATDWIREKYKIHISTQCMMSHQFYPVLYNMRTGLYVQTGIKPQDSPYKAIEKALLYVLKNMEQV